jgi:UDP-4-amino-4,6-dideoxy-N-acetyl-beta-L-altrosamine transaminase
MTSSCSIPYGRQHITDDDIQSVVEVLTSDFLTQGPKILEFEEAFSDYVGAKYAVAVSNGTAALHLANLVLEVKPEHKIITTPITFAATANSVLYCGAEVDFVDIDPDTYLLDLSKLATKLKSAPQGTYAGVIVVDFTGLPVNTEKVRELADEYGLWVIEDACHAPGGYFVDSKNDKIKCGSNVYTDLTCFSFHPVKHIATGEGGMITTNDKGLHKRLMKLRTHGITKENMQENHGGWYHEMQELGYNYRISDINCALGISQLKRAKKGLLRRRELASRYKSAFKEVEQIKLQYQPQNSNNACHLYVIEVDNRKELYNFLIANNIYSQIHYLPVHMHPYYKKLGWRKGDLPVAEKYYEGCISLPLFPTLTNQEQDYVITKILEFVS